jgi:DNA primase large subunit
MNRKRIGLMIGIIALIFCPALGMGQTPKKAPEPQEFSRVVQELEQDFQKARENFLAKKWKDSAEAIRRGKSYLQSEAARAADKSKEALASSAEELQRLADKVEQGAAKSVRELDTAFSRANSALAQYYYRMANESWIRKEASKAGDELRAAAFHLEKGIVRAEGKVESGAQSVIQKTGQLAGKMIEGGKVAEGDVEKGIQDLGKEIEKLGKKVEKVGQ